MDDLKDRFLQVSYVLLCLVWFFIAAGFIAYAFGFFPEFDIQEFLSGKAGTILLYGLGALSAFVGFYFLRKGIVSFRLYRTFVHENDFGDIHISYYAVKELTKEILKDEFELSSFRTKLSQSLDGIGITVYAKVGSKADIGKLGERVQEILRKEINERTGLTVGRVDFYTRGVESLGEEESEEELEEEQVGEIKLEGDNDEN